ncbi:hypothetical protein HN51_062934 [Arachis hypogaea]|uniref:GTD-binding domain-containing protein n=1 Tax=Arachis hypogaea TaxID=3818 RepID=A0A445B079_ARAHY|nr:probable myosin-binding protein 5 isoform X1 [Arachis ipaensis]XP_025629220.1 probable myosin-binding protein 5 isoform X1 [Arachis hypogaea]QHO20463.1 putative myosin-binding protein [Arachis hypogaea]RYR32084.1 hypothetical protein Ahy_B01g057081 [Arachis hypogaea]
MATKPFTRFVEQKLGKLPLFLMNVLLEWVLIILLFLDGFIALFANELAVYFELQIPCWLCTRMAHILAHRTPTFYYNNCWCESHKKEISSLFFCTQHKKITDIRKMCERCLFSFANGKDSDSETYKSLLGILQRDLEFFVEDGQKVHLSLKDDGIMQFEKGRIHKCACCGATSTKSSVSKGKSSGAHLRAPAASPRAHPNTTSKNEESSGLESPHVRSAALRLLSENEDGSGKTLKIRLREEAKSTSLPPLAEGEEGNSETTPKTTPSFAKGIKFFGESPRSPTFLKGGKFFWLPISDSPSNSPKLSYKKSPLEKTEIATEVAEGSTQSRFFWVPITDSTSTSTSPRWTTRKSLLEKTEQAGDSNEATAQTEGDDPNSLLKRQVHMDHKSLMALCMELDEERNASAIAAKNAMAMITRLQEEKAALQMDALQYQRMMEEQIEYEQENLQATNEMLAKLEEEVKALESECDVYRNKYGALPEEEIKEAQLSHAEAEGGEDNNNNNGENDPKKGVKAEKTYLLGRMLKKPEHKIEVAAESGDQSLQNKNKKPEHKTEVAAESGDQSLQNKNVAEKEKEKEKETGDETNTR